MICFLIPFILINQSDNLEAMKKYMQACESLLECNYEEVKVSKEENRPDPNEINIPKGICPDKITTCIQNDLYKNTKRCKKDSTDPSIWKLDKFQIYWFIFV